LGTGGRVFKSHRPEKNLFSVRENKKENIMGLSVELVLCYLFSSLTAISSLMVIRSENPVHSVLFLILAFFNSAGLLLLLEVEFLAMLLVIVYVGAVAVLFLFVVMMLNIKASNETGDLLRFLPIGGLVGLIFLFEVFLVIEGNLTSLLGSSEVAVGIIQWSQKVDQVTNVEVLGQVLYTYYFYFFLAASISLLVSMIGAIVLVMQTSPNVKRQQIFQQVSRDYERAVFLTSRGKD
jgi:NADH-quinone oxidoreductase subunit J